MKKIEIFALLIFALIFLSLLAYILMNKSLDEWSKNEYAKVFFLKVSPIIIQPFFLRSHLKEDVKWTSRIINDVIQILLPPLIALVTFLISLTEKSKIYYSEDKFKSEFKRLKIPIIIFFLLNLLSGCRMFYLSMKDFKYNRKNPINPFPRHIKLVYTLDLISGGLFLIPLHAADHKPFIVYGLSYVTIIVVTILSFFYKRIGHSLRYLTRTLLVGIISYFVTTDYLLMNNISITTSVFAASIILSYVISESHKLEESYIFKLDKNRDNITKKDNEITQMGHKINDLEQRLQRWPFKWISWIV